MSQIKDSGVSHPVRVQYAAPTEHQAQGMAQERIAQEGIAQEEDRSRAHCSGRHRSGENRSRAHCSGRHRSGEDRSRAHCSGRHRSGENRSRAHCSGRHRSGENRSRAHCSGRHRSGENRSRAHLLRKASLRRESLKSALLRKASLRRESLKSALLRKASLRRRIAQERIAQEGIAQERIAQERIAQEGIAQRARASAEYGRIAERRHASKRCQIQETLASLGGDFKPWPCEGPADRRPSGSFSSKTFRDRETCRSVERFPRKRSHQLEIPKTGAMCRLAALLENPPSHSFPSPASGPRRKRESAPDQRRDRAANPSNPWPGRHPNKVCLRLQPPQPMTEPAAVAT